MRVLMIEDDGTYAKTLGLILRQEGYEFEHARDGEDGIALAREYGYNIILLDLGLKDMEGHAVLKQLRDKRVATPVLILTGRDGIDEKIKALGFGADDYVMKDVDRRELVARIQAIIRRSSGHSDNSVDIGALSVDLGARMASVSGQAIHLTTKEYAVLELLALRRGNTISKEALVNHIYSGLDEPDPKIVDVFICRIRRKIAEQAGGLNYIETAWGRGYRLREPVANDVGKSDSETAAPAKSKKKIATSA